jgi:hypothetical protein
MLPPPYKSETNEITVKKKVEHTLHSMFPPLNKGAIEFSKQQRTQWPFPKKNNNKQTPKQHHNVFMSGQKNLLKPNKKRKLGAKPKPCQKATQC